MKQCIIKIGMASCGRAAGAEEIYKSAEDHINKHNLDCRLMKTACIGMCFAEPLIEFIMSDMPDITYGRVTSEEISGLIDSYLAGKPQEEKVIISRESTSNFDIQGQENDSLKKQTRIVLRNCGIIDPESIEDYINRQGYMALQKALKE
ncbi:MAG TPA: NADH-quinone oxidoreductase subunit F, partial [Candidatus Cloacimonadota bacterium]|nr:NADH-quinone oxidoreductase subunit F [Candidatus Cloacimonadota bacterium]